MSTLNEDQLRQLARWARDATGGPGRGRVRPRRWTATVAQVLEMVPVLVEDVVRARSVAGCFQETVDLLLERIDELEAELARLRGPAA